ncbi:GNAT family N-acetyltransferase [Streptomyces sp. SID2131]|nr:GNAT family N-acetyltransferase [Streptomyces sp. SID2131]
MTTTFPDISINTDRLVLRALEEADAPALAEMMNDELVGAWTAVPQPFTEAAAREWITGYAPAERAAGRGLDLAVTEFLTQRLVGTGKDGEVRWQRVQAFAGAASLELQERPGVGGAWLRAWRADAPKDPGGAAVHAEFLVQQAWRSSSAGTDDFRIILEEALKVTEEAALLAPGDPVPYITRLAVARGLGYGHEQFDQVWAKVIDRAPQHMGAHLAALHYWCEKWHGSREEADHFATTAAARAPRGSLLAALPLFAVHEHVPDVVLVQDFFRTQVVAKAVEGALYAVHSARPDDPMQAHVRHLLIWFLVRGERWAEAMHQLVKVDGHVGAVPWTLSADPAAEYTVFRNLAVAGYEANGGSPLTLPR